jgi:hypothetical protein
VHAEFVGLLAGFRLDTVEIRQDAFDHWETKSCLNFSNVIFSCLLTTNSSLP